LIADFFMLAAAARVDLLVEKLDSTIVMQVATARVEEVLPSISKLSCSEDRGGGGRFIRENQKNPT
jgi:hypothetical protein